MIAKQLKNIRQHAGKVALGVAGAVLAACSVPMGSGGGNQFDPNAPVEIALLLPAGGNVGEDAIARDIERAAKMALGPNAPQNINLTTYATGADPTRAAAQAQAAINAGADMIIGPLFSTEVAAVSGINSVPVLALSNNSTLTTSNISILGSSFETIANRVIGASKSQGNDRLGIVASNDLAGNQGTQATVRAAANNRVNVVAASKYDLNEESISQNAPQIAATLRGAGADSVLFTDTTTGGLLFMTDALADNNYTSAEALFMGLARWDNPPEALETPELAGGIFAVPDPAKSRAFNDAFRAQFGRDPHPLAGLGFDGAMIARRLVEDAIRTGDTTPFGPDDLRRRQGFDGALGAIRILPNGQTDRAMAVMQVSNGRAVVVSPAPQGF